jgi:hypothetical protein
MTDRKMLPREHGAYAQLLFPLLSGLLMGRPTLGGLGLALAAVLLFLAYEPAAIYFGARGPLPKRELGAAARSRFLLLGAAGIAAGVLSLAAVPPFARWLALVPAGLAAGLVPLIPARKVRSLPGEALAAAAFAGMHLPLAAAGGASGIALYGPAVVWWASTVLATLGVHTIKARLKGKAPWLIPLCGGGATAAVAAGLALPFAGARFLGVGLALLLPSGAVLAVHLAKVHPRHLKRVGWTIAASDLAALLVLVLAR